MPIIHSQFSESGMVTINPDTCKHCGACARICPTDVLMEEDGTVRISNDSLLGCIACGHCMMVCPEGSVTVRGRGISPEDLVSLPDPDKKANGEAVAALMQSRRSVRQFKEQEVDPEVLKRVVDMAATAPMGIPPWDVGCVVVQGRKEVQRIAAELIKGYEGFLKIFKPWLLAVMRPFLGQTKYDMFAHFVRPLAKKYVQGHRKGHDVLFYEAPALLIFHHSPYADAADAAIACTYAMLAAESLGLGNTMIGGAAPILQRNKVLCTRLGIPPGNRPSISLIVGHPASRYRKAIRRQFSHVNFPGRD